MCDGGSFLLYVQPSCWRMFQKPFDVVIYFTKPGHQNCFLAAAVNRIKQIIANGMRPKGAAARLPGALPVRSPAPQSTQGPPVPTMSLDQPPPLMSLNTTPSTVSKLLFLLPCWITGQKSEPICLMLSWVGYYSSEFILGSFSCCCRRKCSLGWSTHLQPLMWKENCWDLL